MPSRPDEADVVPEPITRPLVVGVPKETKVNEYRVSVTPDGVSELVHHGVTVVVEAGAGAESAIPDDEYRRAGAQIAATAEEVWERAEVVCKVKEPQAAEFELMREGQVLFTYLHLAAYPAVGQALLDRRVTGIAYETVQLSIGGAAAAGPHERGRRPDGAPDRRPLPGAAQRRAGRAARRGAGRAARPGGRARRRQRRLERGLDRGRHGGRGGHPRPEPRPPPLGRPDPPGPHPHPGLQPGAVERSVAEADMVVGAVLVPGGRAPSW